MFEKEYFFKGKHAEYVLDLANSARANVITRNIDIYIIAPILGLIYGRKGEIDNQEPTTKIFAETIIGEQKKLQFIYRLIILYEGSKKCQTSNELLERAFREDNDEEIMMQNMEIFNNYVLGGVELIHEKIFEDSNDKDEYIHNIYNFLEEFNEDMMSNDHNQSSNMKELLDKFSEM